MGKEQKYYFHLYDIAAVIKLPWSWPLGESTWSLDTRLLASAGLLTGADESGLMMTVVPGLGLNAWDGLVTFDAGAGAGFFSNYKFGTQDFGGRCKSSRPRGFVSIHFPTPMPAFGSNTSPMPACTNRPVSAWTCTSQNLATGSNPNIAGPAIPSDVNSQASPYRPMRLRKNYVGTLELRWSSCVAQQETAPAGCSKRPSSKAAASEGPRRTLWGTLRV